MFTGLVEEVGTIASIVERGDNHRITINAPDHGERIEGRQQRRRQRRLPDRARYHAAILLRRPGRRNLEADLASRASPRARWSTWSCR